jgi:hypothetical protein
MLAEVGLNAGVVGLNAGVVGCRERGGQSLASSLQPSSSAIPRPPWAITQS